MGNLKNRINEGQILTKKIMPDFPKKRMLLEVNNLCNHKCLFCANSKMTRKRGFMKEEFAFRILEEANTLGMREVGFYATGEPLINKNIVNYVEKAKLIGFEYVYLTTNGALATKKVIENLVDVGIDSIKFSINAGSRKSYEKIHGKDDFNTVIDNLRYVDSYRKRQKKNVKLYVSCILNQINKNEKEILENLISDFVDEIVFINVMNVGGMMYEVNDTLKIDSDENDIYPQYPCSLLFNAVTITYEGYLTACCTDFQNYLVVADLNKVNLLDGWNSEVFQRLRKMHLEEKAEGTLCYNCIYNKNENVFPLQEKYATRYDVKTFDKKAEIIRAVGGHGR